MFLYVCVRIFIYIVCVYVFIHIHMHIYTDRGRGVLTCVRVRIHTSAHACAYVSTCVLPAVDQSNANKLNLAGESMQQVKTTERDTWLC